MKPFKMRGMRNIPTFWAMVNRAVPTTAESAATEMAHLAHEKARLQRELEIWVTNSQKVQERLGLLEERVAILQQVIEKPGSAGPGSSRRASRGGQGQPKNSAGDKPGGRVRMEY